MAISDYYISFDDTEQALKILEDYLSRTPNHIKILDQILKGEKIKPGSYRGRKNSEPEDNRKTLLKNNNA